MQLLYRPVLLLYFTIKRESNQDGKNSRNYIWLIKLRHLFKKQGALHTLALLAQYPPCSLHSPQPVRLVCDAVPRCDCVNCPGRREAPRCLSGKCCSRPAADTSAAQRFTLGKARPAKVFTPRAAAENPIWRSQLTWSIILAQMSRPCPLQFLKNVSFKSLVILSENMSSRNYSNYIKL